MKAFRTIEPIQQERLAKGVLFAAFRLEVPLAFLPHGKRLIHHWQSKPTGRAEDNLFAARLQSTWVGVEALTEGDRRALGNCLTGRPDRYENPKHEISNLLHRCPFPDRMAGNVYSDRESGTYPTVDRDRAGETRKRICALGEAVVTHQKVEFPQPVAFGGSRILVK